MATKMIKSLQFILCTSTYGQYSIFEHMSSHAPNEQLAFLKGSLKQFDLKRCLHRTIHLTRSRSAYLFNRTQDLHNGSQDHRRFMKLVNSPLSRIFRILKCMQQDLDIFENKVTIKKFIVENSLSFIQLVYFHLINSLIIIQYILYTLRCTSNRILYQ